MKLSTLWMALASLLCLSPLAASYQSTSSGGVDCEGCQQRNVTNDLKAKARLMDNLTSTLSPICRLDVNLVLGTFGQDCDEDSPGGTTPDGNGNGDEEPDCADAKCWTTWQIVATITMEKKPDDCDGIFFTGTVSDTLFGPQATMTPPSNEISGGVGDSTNLFPTGNEPQTLSVDCGDSKKRVFRLELDKPNDIGTPENTNQYTGKWTPASDGANKLHFTLSCSDCTEKDV